MKVAVSAGEVTVGPQIARAGLIDLDITVFFQLAVFLTLLVILNKLAFQPLLALFEERRKRTEGARSDADAAATRATRLEETVQAGLGDANRAGAAERNEQREAALVKEATALAAARSAASRQVQAEQDRLDKGREDILPDLDRSSRELAEQLVTHLNIEG